MIGRRERASLRAGEPVSASTGATVTILVSVLVLLGLGMIVLAAWLVRSTRSDPQALGPLEVMGERRWRKGDADRRKANLDTARPAGAWPPAPMVALEAGVGDTAGGSTTDAAAAAVPVADEAAADGEAGDGETGEDDTSAGVIADGEAAEASVEEPATVDGDGGEEDTSDGAVAGGDELQGDDAGPSMEQPTISLPSTEDAPADDGTDVDADKRA
jgi:hypothetical protein